MKCPQCAYVRQTSDATPLWQCPSCKVAYIEVLRALEAARVAQQSHPLLPPLPAPVTAEDAEVQAERRLWKIARGQKILLYSMLANLLLAALGGLPPSLAAFLLFAANAVFALRGVAGTGSGLGMPQGTRIGFLVLAFFPILNLVALLYLNVRATAFLRRAGWTVGLLGARP